MNRRRQNAPSEPDFLSGLVLWQNNPEHVAMIAEHALQGNRDAQYALGLCYAEGRGIEEDHIEAYYWLSLAIEQGDRDAELLRQVLQQSMSLQQINAADQLTRNYLVNLDRYYA